jgi:D-aminopeptidase
MRARELGIRIGRMQPGQQNAITDVAGVRVGHATLISGDGPLRVGEGPVRTGVTVIVPHDGDIWTEPVFAGAHRLNGNGELTGLEWIREAGMLAGAIGITNTHSVGVVHDALIQAAVRAHAMSDAVWALPVAGETYDGALNDINGFHVQAEHLHAALAGATDGPVAEGNVGGGTGMICHEFKAGIGTASRRAGDSMVGVLVQANYGERELLRIDGVPVGAAISREDVPSPWDQVEALGPRAGPREARSSASWRPMRRCSPTSARDWRSGSGWEWPAWAAMRHTDPATCSAPSRRAIATCRETPERETRGRRSRFGW